MNLYLRMIWLWLFGRYRDPVGLLGPCITSFRVNVLDLDVLRHMNNGRYFSIMDLARVDLMQRSGLLPKLTKAGLYPVVTAESLLFRRSLKWPQGFEVATEVVGWDDKCFLLTQRFIVAGEEVAAGVVRARFLRKTGGSATPDEVLALSGQTLAMPETPAWLASWRDVFETGVQAPKMED